jgi:hypothetical protein
MLEDGSILDPTYPGDKLMIFWRKDGVLLVTDTYGKRINNAKAYLNYRGPWEACEKCSYGGGHPSVEKDARKGLRFTLDRMKELGEILPKWEHRPFLWLLSYMDTKRKDYDYKAINAARIEKLPKEVQEAITPK